MKMALRRGESFQSVIMDAVERYVRADVDIGTSAGSQEDLIAALHAEILRKKSADSVTNPSIDAVSELRIDLREIREMLTKLVRILDKNTQGDQPLAEFGSDLQKPETTAPSHDPASPYGRLAGNRISAREADSTEAARDIIEHARRTRRRASEDLELDLPTAGQGKAPRKKAG